jgi:hypothetical protein
MRCRYCLVQLDISGAFFYANKNYMIRLHEISFSPPGVSVAGKFLYLATAMYPCLKKMLFSAIFQDENLEVPNFLLNTHTHIATVANARQYTYLSASLQKRESPILQTRFVFFMPLRNAGHFARARVLLWETPFCASWCRFFR